MEKTTIQVQKQTLERLKSVKQYERQPYDEILNNLLNETEEEVLTEEEIKEIQYALEDIKKGKTFTIEQVAKEFGVKLD